MAFRNKFTELRNYGPPSLPVPRPGRETPRSTRLAEGSSSPISLVVCVWFLYLHRCRSRGPAVQGATGSGRTWQRRSVATPPFFRPTRYPPSPTLPPAARLRAARAHARALAHRISVCALSSEAPITPGIHGRRGVPPEARIEAPAPSTRRDPRHHQPLPGNTASAFPLVALRIPQIPQGAWTRSSLGVNSSGPYLGSAEHACQRTFEYLRQLPPPRS